MGVGSSHPAPSFPLRREILAQGGSLLVLMCLVWVVLATLPLALATQLAHISQSNLGVPWPLPNGEEHRCSLSVGRPPPPPLAAHGIAYTLPVTLRWTS